MDLKKKIEENIIVIVVGAAISSGATVHAVDEYYRRQSLSAKEAEQQDNSRILRAKHQEEVRELVLEKEAIKLKASSIERRMGGNNFIDVSKFFKNSNGFEPGTRYFPKGRFVAPVQIGDWKLTSQTMTDHLKGMFQSSLMTPSIISGVQDIYKHAEFYKWSGPKSYSVDHPSLSAISDHIVVEMLPFDKLEQIIAANAILVRSSETSGNENSSYLTESLNKSETVKLQEQSPEKTKAAVASVVDELLNSDKVKVLTKTFRSDFIGVKFAEMLISNYTLAQQSPATKFHVRQIQRVGSVLYSQFVLSFDNVSINGRTIERAFIIRELFMFSEPDHVLIVTISNVSETPDFQSSQFRDSTLWLGGLRIVEQ